jgi:CMP-N-acetylneuraminic acid synthetase
MIDACVDVLLTDPAVDSAFVALETHKNYWRRRGDRWVRLADDIPYGTPRQSKEALYREDTGLALATRAAVVLAGARLGPRCVVLPHSHPAEFIDIHSELDLQVAEFLITQLGIHPNQDGDEHV